MFTKFYSEYLTGTNDLGDGRRWANNIEMELKETRYGRED